MLTRHIDALWMAPPLDHARQLPLVPASFQVKIHKRSRTELLEKLLKCQELRHSDAQRLQTRMPHHEPPASRKRHHTVMQEHQCAIAGLANVTFERWHSRRERRPESLRAVLSPRRTAPAVSNQGERLNSPGSHDDLHLSGGAPSSRVSPNQLPPSK